MLSYVGLPKKPLIQLFSEETCTSFRVTKMTRTVFEIKVVISTQKTVCNKTNNSIHTDKIYLHAMLEVIMDEQS